jgi:hypothetical protein
MSRITGRKSRTAAPVALVALLACLLLAACGSSSKSSSTSNAASTSASTTTGSSGTKPGGAAGAKRFTAVRECLQKNGITLPKRTPGQRPGGGAGGFLGGGTGSGPTLPKGVTRAQYEAAIKKCGGFGGGRFGAGGGTSRFNSPAVKQALSKFASCMRENGVNLPTPNTSGKGPVFNTKGLETTGAKFKAAQTKCASDLVSAFRARPGAGGAPAGTGTPPGSPG